MHTQKQQQGSFWLATIFILAIVGLIAVLIAPVLTDVQSFASKFGFKSRTELKQDVKKANNSLEIAVDENKFLAEKIQKQADTNDATVSAVDTRHRIDESIDKTTIVAKQKRQKQIESLDAKYKEKPKTTVNEVKHSQEVAAVHIASVWGAYCSFNADPSCSASDTSS